MISRVPDLSDIHYMLTILSELGCEVERASGTVTVKAEKVITDAPYDIVRKMRASVCILGPLLGREKEATVSLPGGCIIGDRPIDLHLRGFEALGAAVLVQSGNVKVLAPELKGATINLRGKFGSTVLGTDNVMMAAVARGRHHRDRRRGRRTRSRGPREFPHQDGREDRRRRHPPHHRGRREGTSRRGTRRHPRPHRGRHLSHRRAPLPARKSRSSAWIPSI